MLQKPYYYVKGPLAHHDFEKVVIEPVPGSIYPDGAVQLLVDDCCWTVAIVPYSWRDLPLQAIVAKFWPEYSKDAAPYV